MPHEDNEFNALVMFRASGEMLNKNSLGAYQGGASV